ncbi:sulfite exporter TauE/SafE family protein [Catellatospora sp. KI3]|uniref:sulfite exporter TauE/SafE family protein n=1 Tax=Catellatospora sp. KI3 TaxID=3041620 RepID=UPI0024831911|nr:sulfite exporter TauE/SafE family protein [Catellatospora sp. KI3]MDI1465917.1 sulfite exporter TauE/SafE family protein [Catellatospora sp. KI3]
MDLWVGVGGFVVGVIVGLTGMGGGALMTPLLVLVFGVAPLAAVSSDLVASAIMKPFGGAVHLRRGTVDKALVGWLCAGSIPAAFAGVFIARAMKGDGLEQTIQYALGAALLLAASGLVIKVVLGIRAQGRAAAGLAEAVADDHAPVRVRIIPTVLVGVVGGLVVGVTSVGSGSLIVIALMALYPRLHPHRLVGTDLVQAVPLVASAALAHLLFGDFQFGLTATLVAGAVPGVLLGAAVSTRAPAGLIRGALTVVLVASGAKLLGASTPVVGALALGLLIVLPVAWILLRRGAGLPALPSRTPAPAEPEPVGAAN